jgi:hypothetical protein
VVGDEAALVLGQQQGVAELGRRPQLALADRPGVRITQAHQPIRDHPVAGQPLVGLGQQPPGGGDRLLQLTDQPTQPPITRPAGTCPAGGARYHLHVPQGVPRDPGDLGGEPVHLRHCHPGAPPQAAGQLPASDARPPGHGRETGSGWPRHGP